MARRGLLLLALAPSAHAAALLATSTIVIGGTDGRDEITVTRTGLPTPKIVVVGAASVSGGTLSNGTPACTPTVSPLTNRAVVAPSAVRLASS